MDEVIIAETCHRQSYCSSFISVLYVLHTIDKPYTVANSQDVLYSYRYKVFNNRFCELCPFRDIRVLELLFHNIPTLMKWYDFDG